jgi:carboxyl-terminal processing protease
MKYLIKISIPLFFLLFPLTSGAQGNPETNKLVNKLGQTLFFLNNYYLDTLNDNELVDAAIISMLSELDPHSSYVNARDVKAMNEPLVGNFEGVGIEYAIIRDTLTVSAPIAGGPCERAGVRAGDKIVAVDSENIASVNLTNERVQKYLRGAKGTRVRLDIIRKGENKILTFDIIRDKIPINSLDACYEVNPGVIYLKLSRFAATSAKEIINALVDLDIKKINGVILDLRGNTGGYLGTALEIANFFLEGDQVIVYTEGLRVPKMTEKANGNGFYKKGPLAVLIDENSASASEIVAGAIQDWDRGVIIGRRSFGKGLVQQMLPLNDGSQLRLTVARYHTPSGRVIQMPYKNGNSKDYYKEHLERYSRGEYFSKDSISLPDSLKFKTLIEKRTVFGGGGIMPDIFVPADTTYYSDYFSVLIRKNILLDFMNSLSDSRRSEWQKRYTDFDNFLSNFVVEERIFQDLFSYAKEKGIPVDISGAERSKDIIALNIKALVARTLFGMTGYYRVINSQDDEAFDKALLYVSSKSGV